MCRSTTMAGKTKRSRLLFLASTATLFFFFLFFFFTVVSLLLYSTPTAITCSALSSIPHHTSWTGDLRSAEFAWNRLSFNDFNSTPPPAILKIAVFSRKWPAGSTPGGMERHALTLHSALASRGHEVHIFTSSAANKPIHISQNSPNPIVHYHDDSWQYRIAWEQYELENAAGKPFDVVHSESVALPHFIARLLPNIAVSWHGIALESLSSSIYQDLIRPADDEQMSTTYNATLQTLIPKLLNEIRFFKNYQHHVATSDSSGKMLRDVYQIPSNRVHVIINGVNNRDFIPDKTLGQNFRAKIGIPNNANLVFGVAGRLVKDKGHPILFEAFSNLQTRHPNIYLIVAGSGPWEARYKELGDQVIILGSLKPSELRVFYNAIDIFVNPTLRPQGLDLTLMEAMMSGKPVMASRFPSIKGTVVVDEEFGFMFAPNAEEVEATMEMVVKEGAGKMARRGEACREYAVSMFSASKMALAYERLFLCIMNKTFCFCAL